MFLTLSGYSHIALCNAIEVLQTANRVHGSAVYQWRIASLHGNGVTSSNGCTMEPTERVDASDSPDLVLICGGEGIENAITPDLSRQIRQWALYGISLGSLCTGSYALARAGVLGGYHAVAHWEQLPALREQFQQTQFSNGLYKIDRDRFTCGGGTASLHMMLSIVRSDSGKQVTAKMLDQLTLERIRDDTEEQYIPLSTQVGRYQAHLLDVAALMEANVEEPLSLEHIAELVGVTRRQIERLFKRHVGEAPGHYYVRLRLQRARKLLLETPMSIIEISTACGFHSSPHFSKCYRDQYGHTPSAERGSAPPIRVNTHPTCNALKVK